MQDDLRASLDVGRMASQLRDRHLSSVHYDAGDIIFRPGDPSDDIFIIEEGTVSMKTNFMSFTNQEEQSVSVSLGSTGAEFEHTPSAPDRYLLNPGPDPNASAHLVSHFPQKSSGVFFQLGFLF